MKLPKPCVPFEQLDIRGESITIDVSAKRIVIPTDNQLTLPSFNQWTENPNRCNLIETPCGGLKNSIVQDKFPGSLSIEGDGCYIQNVAGTYTGKSLGAGKLSETTDIKDTGTTGIALATANGTKVKMMDGNFILLRPPSCIVEEFKVVNISNVAATYTLTIQCPDLVDSIELYNLDSGHSESVTFTKVNNSYTFSRTLSYNSFETLQITIKYQSLESTTEFVNDANTTIGLQNMSKSWIALIPKTGYEIDIFSFTERPSELSYKQETDGTISQLILYPGNGSINHSRITYPNHSLISGTGTIPDCLNENIEGSVTKFLQSYGMKTDFSSDATITTWVVPAISDTKILPLSEISDEYLGDTITIRASPGEYTCASFVVRSDKNINLEIKTSDLVYGENIISSDEIDIKTVKCWYQGGYDASTYAVTGRYLTPELLLHDDTLVRSNGDWYRYDLSNADGKNYLKCSSGDYINISENPQLSNIDLSRLIDPTMLQTIHLRNNANYQCWITFHIPNNTISGTYINTLMIGTHTLNLVVQILPISLYPPNIQYGIYYLGIISTSNSILEAKTVEQFTAEMLDMKKHGITNPTIWYPSIDNTFTQELEIRQQCGIDNTTIYYIQGSSTWNDITIVTAQQISELKTLCIPYGMETLYLYGYDEHNLDTPEIRAQIDMVHENGAKIFCAQEPRSFSSQATDIADVLDLAIVGFGLDSELSTIYHSYISFDNVKHKIFSYSHPQAVPELPHTFRKNYGLLLWQHEYDGVMDYAYQRSVNSIWNDFDFAEYRDHVFAYPTANGVIDTIQWEGFREAVNDMRYLTTLQNVIMEANNRGVVTTDIDSWITTLKTADLTNVDFDEIRSQMIDYILQLQSSQNYSAVLMENGKAILFKDGTQLFLEG